MYYLGIVLKKDMNDGYINAEYVLCKCKSKSNNRTGLRVFRYGSSLFKNAKKVIVPTIDSHPELIDFLSNYRTRDIMHTTGKKHDLSKKYAPEGALFWFECNEYGEDLGNKIFIKRIPDKSVGKKNDDGKERLEEWYEQEFLFKDLLKDDESFVLINKKVQLTQQNPKWIKKKKG